MICFRFLHEFSVCAFWNRGNPTISMPITQVKHDAFQILLLKCISLDVVILASPQPQNKGESPTRLGWEPQAPAGEDNTYTETIESVHSPMPPC